MDYLALTSEHVESLYPIIVYGKPRLMDLPPGAIIGTWAYSVPGKVRFILDRTLELAPGVLPGDLARAWIRDQYALPIRRRKNQMVRGYTVPLYAKRGLHGLCTYIDIKGAYLSVLRLGYDVEYSQGRYIGAEPRPIPGEIARCKFAYAIAVAMSHSPISHLEVMGKEGVFKHNPINLYSNPCLYNLAQDTLNAIGAELLAVLPQHIVYANTDGYLVKDGFEADAIEIIRSWGFEATVKIINGIVLQGETEVRGVASYKVGKYQTRRFDPSAEDFQSPMMDRDARRWLKTRMVKWAEKLNVQEGAI